ncbi:MAG: hypothetical protein HY597_07010, partial [Candidatus Omnitrophica bacterium]|nr:hypothetical protein [Candidatus Omnitrophota bacterium]
VEGVEPVRLRSGFDTERAQRVEGVEGPAAPGSPPTRVQAILQQELGSGEVPQVEGVPGFDNLRAAAVWIYYGVYLAERDPSRALSEEQKPVAFLEAMNKHITDLFLHRQTDLKLGEDGQTWIYGPKNTPVSAMAEVAQFRRRIEERLAQYHFLEPAAVNPAIIREVADFIAAEPPQTILVHQSVVGQTKGLFQLWAAARAALGQEPGERSNLGTLLIQVNPVIVDTLEHRDEEDEPPQRFPRAQLVVWRGTGRRGYEDALALAQRVGNDIWVAEHTAVQVTSQEPAAEPGQVALGFLGGNAVDVAWAALRNYPELAQRVRTEISRRLAETVNRHLEADEPRLEPSMFEVATEPPATPPALVIGPEAWLETLTWDGAAQPLRIQFEEPTDAEHVRPSPDALALGLRTLKQPDHRPRPQDLQEFHARLTPAGQIELNQQEIPPRWRAEVQAYQADSAAFERGSH